MTDAHLPAYKNYLAAWSAIGGDERHRLLTNSLSPNIVFKNSTRIRSGIPDVAAHLEEFQRMTPGGSFRVVSMLGWGENALVTWQLVKADGTDGFRGYDGITYDETGRMEAIVMFVDIDPQRIT